MLCSLILCLLRVQHWGLAAVVGIVSILSSLKAHCPGTCNVMLDGCHFLCLLLWQVIFLIHQSKGKCNVPLLMFFNQRWVINLQINKKLALLALFREINLSVDGCPCSHSLWSLGGDLPRVTLMNQDACCLLVEVGFLLLTVQTLSLSGFHAVVQTSWITYVWHFPLIPMPALTLLVHLLVAAVVG